MAEAERSRKLTKFGSVKYVFPRELMQAMRQTITETVRTTLPQARILYWT